jgi:hypothetical protein
MHKHKRVAPRGKVLAALIAPRVGAHRVIALDLDKHGRIEWTSVPAWPNGPHVVYLDRSGHRCYGWASYSIRGVPFFTRWDSDGSGNAPATWIRLGGESYQISAHSTCHYEGPKLVRDYAWSADGNTLLDTRPPDAVQDYGVERDYANPGQLEWHDYHLMRHADGGYPYLYSVKGDALCADCATVATFEGTVRVDVAIFHEGTVETCSDCSARIRPFHVLKDE